MENKKVKKIPLRKCMGCMESFPKKELIRVVRTPENEVCVDLTGKKSGRGAYICRNPECLKRARKQRRLESSLECSIPESVYDRLEEALSN